MNIQQKLTPNIYDLEAPPLTLILHTTLGAFIGAVEWLRMSPEEREKRTGRKSYSSAHAVFGRVGEVAKLAPVTKGTWHAGNISKPSDRAKRSLLPKTILGSLKNPNRASIGFEFASGYDIDRDGVLESWEKLYTPIQIKNAVEYTITVLEPAIKKYYGIDYQFSSSTVLTHRDIDAGKPNLDIQRAMFLAELSKQRRAVSVPTPPPPVEPIKKPKVTIEGDVEVVRL